MPGTPALPWHYTTLAVPTVEVEMEVGTLECHKGKRATVVVLDRAAVGLDLWEQHMPVYPVPADRQY